MRDDPARRRVLARWLACVCAALVMLVVVGGITRLTGSGLSIVEWKPVSGIVPPLSGSAWKDAFAAYQRSPQYRLVNAGMSLSQFQAIFFWEYLHRLLGRLIALGFALPLLVFTVRRWIDRTLALRLWGAVALFGAQGALGWFMVESGLVDRPAVSHLRLAAHLSLALVLLAYLAWTARTLSTAPPGETPRGGQWHARAIGLVLGLQIVYGALTAGLHAGLACRTFPDWNGHLFPPEWRALGPLAWNAVSNPSTVQFLHRLIGSTWLALVLGLALRRRRLPHRARVALAALLTAGLGQYALGIAVIHFSVPIPLAALHQLGACVLWLLALELVHATRRVRVNAGVAALDPDQLSRVAPGLAAEPRAAIGTLPRTASPER